MHSSGSPTFLRRLACGWLCVLGLSTVARAGPQAEEVRSVHRAQVAELGGLAQPPTDDDAEAEAHARARAIAAQRALFGSVPGSEAVGVSRRGIDDDFVVFGYLQSETQVYHLRWHALTHVGSRFVGFDANGFLTGTGAFTSRSSYLRAGGAAEAAGVKVVLVLANFDDGPGGSLERVMTSPARRATLVGQLVQILAADGYSHGVSLDLEFSWGPAVRDGITAFAHELRAGLDSLGPGYELSVYTNAIYLASQWDFDATSGLTPTIDYMLYSMYDWASGSTARAISDFDNCLGSSRMHGYMGAGLPPEKLVPVVSAYSRRWNGTAVYGGAGSSPASGGFTDGLYDVTLNPVIGSPAWNYVRQDEAAWVTWNDGTQRIRTFDDPESMEFKIRHALSLQDPSGTWSGRRLGGVGFWSLMWMAELTSVDPRTGGTVARTRTYPHVYQLCREVFASPGERAFTLEAFDGLDFRWRDPNEAPDTRGDTDANSSRSLVASPTGAGNALRLVVDFEGSNGNRAVLAHEVLAHPAAPTVPDTNAVLGHVPRTSRLSVRFDNEVALPGYRLRLLVVDAQGELEASPGFSLEGTGPRTVRWNLSDSGSVAGFPTSEPAFSSGNGVLASVPGQADIGVYGFTIEGDGPAVGSVVFEEIAYAAAPPDGRAYRINEFRYADPATEFVEIHGPAGPLPLGLSLRVYDSTNGSVARSIPLFGSIANAGGGKGYFVVGDPGVAGVHLSTAFDPARDDLADLDPSALQIFDAANGYAHDSVVYEAFGGLDELVRRNTNGVTSNGWPWLGEAANGRDSAGVGYTLGRYPDGRDTRRNARDFSFQTATPGAANGSALTLPAEIDFETTVPAAFQTFDVPRRTSPTSVGLPASADGGAAWRCVDLAGGGVIGVLGDAALGQRRGVVAEGELYVPASTEPAQAVAIGVCGSQGTRFFSSTDAARSAYESGYWLIYENRSGVGLADGRPDHPATWELVHATHDNMDGEPAALLASGTNATLGVSEGQWVRFSFTVLPAHASGDALVVSVGGQELYRGGLPAGGPRSGAFQVAFRENHPGGPSAREGAWVDGLRLGPAALPADPDPDPR